MTQMLPLFTAAEVPADPRLPVGADQVVQTGRDRRWGAGTAVFSTDLRHRFHLSRVWDESLPRANFLMLNPSTADALVLDPTVTRCATYATGWGYGSLTVTNCYALRSTDPAGLLRCDDPVGDGNDEAIVSAARDADLVVAAWGVHAVHLGREAQVRTLLAGAGVVLHYLRLTKAGHPGHPLYLPSSLQPQVWSLTT